MIRAAVVASAVLVWVGVGVYGTFSYGNSYLTYRGFPPPKDPAGVLVGHLVHERIYSQALQRQQSFLVYEPPGYAVAAAAGRRFPVLYLLHGSPGHPQSFINIAAAGVALDTGVDAHTLRPFLLVMPDGSDGTFRADTEWADTPHGRYESWVLEVVHAVDQRFATVANRRHRAIAGLSEGGFGALNIALRHLGLFGIVESWSGYATAGGHGPFSHLSGAVVLANSPAWYVPSMSGRLRTHPLRAYIYSGIHDRGLAPNRAFAAELTAAGGHVTFTAFHGGHDWNLWRVHTPRMLGFADHWFGRAL